MRFKFFGNLQQLPPAFCVLLCCIMCRKVLDIYMVHFLTFAAVIIASKVFNIAESVAQSICQRRPDIKIAGRESYSLVFCGKVALIPAVVQGMRTEGALH